MSAKRRPGRLLGGHLGASVSALVDGQLDDESTERAWQHVQACPACQAEVENEGLVKRRLSGLAEGLRADQPSDRFLGSLRALDPAAAAWVETQEIAAAGRTRRRAGIALVGAGSVSAAVFGLSALSGASFGLGDAGGTPASSIGGSGATGTPTRAVLSPAPAVHGRLRGWTLGPGDGRVAHAQAVDARR